MDAQSFYDGVSENITRTGRSLIAVGDPKTPFTYSIGNVLVGKPELIVFGLAPEDAMWVLNTASELPAIRGIADGDLVDLGGRFGLKAVRCSAQAKAEYSIQATRYLGNADYDLVQLLLPDPAGRYPGDPGCEPPYADAPRLGQGH